MHSFLAFVLEHARPAFIILIHDAIWVQPELPSHVLIDAISRAEAVSGLLVVLLKVVEKVVQFLVVYQKLSNLHLL
jgi:hypothetical protein